MTKEAVLEALDNIRSAIEDDFALHGFFNFEVQENGKFKSRYGMQIVDALGPAQWGNFMEDALAN